MEDLILKVAYPYRDERLFPSGWRSFSNECWIINNIELTKEIIIWNAIEQPRTTEITIVNDLGYSVADITIINQLEITSEVILLNSINDEITTEITIVNGLMTDKFNEIVLINDIQQNDIATKEIILLNSLREAVNFEKYSHSVSIFIDNFIINDYVKNWAIKISEDSYVHSFNISFVNYDLFSLCNPLTNIKTQRVKFIIDETIQFQFLLEKRDVSRQSFSGEFSIWGRSLIALLDLPYAIPITDKDVVQDQTTGVWSCLDDPSYVPHIWQIRDCLASEIIDNVIKPPFTTNSFSLNFLLNDYVVRKGALSVNNSSPIQVVNQLSSAIGGRVRTDLNDKVVVKYYKYNTLGTELIEYTDTENILQLDENISFPEGYNKILVKGWEDPLEEKSIGLKIELDNALNEGKLEFVFGEEIWIRVYCSPFTTTYSISCSLGSLYSEQTGQITSVSEELGTFIGSSMQLSYPIYSISQIQRYSCDVLTSDQYSFTQGYDFINSEDSDIQDEPVIINYSTKSDLYKLVVDQPCDPLPWNEVLSMITIKQL